MPVISLLLWLATCGADPNLVLSDTADPRAGFVFGQELVTNSSTTLLGSAADQRSSRVSSAASRPFVVRSQSLDSTSEEIISDPIQPPHPMGWSQAAVGEFLMEMNPLSPINLRVVEDYYDPYGWQQRYGNTGYQPWRLGWVTYNDTTILPSAPVTSGTTGRMQIIEWNSNVRISELISPGVLFNATGYFNAQWWNGPSGIALPGQVDEVSADLELGLFNGGPWSGQIAFHPQFVDSYQSRIGRYAFNFDGRAIATYQASPNWSFVGGVAFWDRLNVIVVPHVGVIWAPNERWELRMLWPKSRISYFLGRWSTTDFWAYGGFEYTAEAWQVDIGGTSPSTDRIQITDDQLTLGLRWDSGRYSFFVEGGYIFNRQVKFIGPTPDFNLGDIEMLRLGIRY